MSAMKCWTAIAAHNAGQIGKKKRDKMIRASASGKKQNPFNPAPLKNGEESFLKRIWHTMSNWRSKKSIQAEEKRKAKEAAEAAKEKATV